MRPLVRPLLLLLPGWVRPRTGWASGSLVLAEAVAWLPREMLRRPPDQVAKARSLRLARLRQQMGMMAMTTIGATTTSKGRRTPTMTLSSPPLETPRQRRRVRVRKKTRLLRQFPLSARREQKLAKWRKEQGLVMVMTMNPPPEEAGTAMQVHSRKMKEFRRRRRRRRMRPHLRSNKEATEGAVMAITPSTSRSPRTPERRLMLMRLDLRPYVTDVTRASTTQPQPRNATRKHPHLLLLQLRLWP